MAFATARISVGTSATQLNTTADTDFAAASGYEVARRYGSSIFVRPYGGSIFVGPAGVTSATGTEFKDGEFLTMDCLPGDLLYAATASGTVLCHVLQSGV